MNNHMMSLNNEKRWILYDFANSVFAVSIMSGFFPLLFRKYWAADLASEKITLYLGLTNSILSCILFFILPFLGYMMDSKFKKPHKILFYTACIGALLTSTLFFVNQGDHTTSLLLYSLSFLFFAMGNTQYDGLLYKVSEKKDLDHLEKLSSLGYLFGYFGGGLGLLLQSLLIIFHKKLGFESALLPAKIAFISTALWWLIFSLPLLKLRVLRAKTEKKSNFILNTKKFLKSLNKKTILFLIAFFLYIDVVYTAYKMAADFGLSVGLDQNELIAALLYVQIVAVPGTYLMLLISKKFSTRVSLNFGLLCYALVLALSPFTKTPLMFFILASFIGLAQGGIQSLSRSYFSSLIDENLQGLGFGFLNIFGKLSAIIGPTLMGVVTYTLKDHTYSVLSLMPFLVIGALMLHLSFKEDLQ